MFNLSRRSTAFAVSAALASVLATTASAGPAIAAPANATTPDTSPINSLTIHKTATKPPTTTINGSTVTVGDTAIEMESVKPTSLSGAIRTFTGDGGMRQFVHPQVDGVQILWSARGPASPHKATYAFKDRTLERIPNDMILVRAKKTGEPMGLIDAPWAKDSRGKAVKTQYIIGKQGTLTQTISPTRDSVYPIIADPRIRTTRKGLIFGVTVDFSRHETRLIQRGMVPCLWITNFIPHPLAQLAAKIDCAAVGALAYAARRQGKCLSISIFPLTAIPWISRCYA